MKSLGLTTAELKAFSQRWAKTTPARSARPVRSRLREVALRASNPGNLRMLTYVPPGATADAPLVVALHGCTQTAADYDHGTGWSTLADQHGFVLLFPEQQAINNPKTCFTWFSDEDTTRGRGEAESIYQMITQMIEDHTVDPARVFVTGLSAGGAMTAVMLAAYPEVFAGGAIIAGLPYGTANSVQEAFQSMFQGTRREPGEWGDMVREASPHAGPWPSVSIWHGTADMTVTHLNSEQLARQWTDVHGVADASPLEVPFGAHRRRTWHAEDGTPVVHEYEIAGMAHGVPLDGSSNDARIGNVGAYMLDVGLPSTRLIAADWGIASKVVIEAPAARPRASERPSQRFEQRPQMKRSRLAAPKGLMGSIESTISKALRGAGLMK